VAGIGVAPAEVGVQGPGLDGVVGVVGVGSAAATRLPAPVAPRLPAPPPRPPAPASTDRPRTRAPGRPAPALGGPRRPGRCRAWAAGRQPGAAAELEFRPAPTRVSTAARSPGRPPPPARPRAAYTPARTSRPHACDGPRPTAAASTAKRLLHRRQTQTGKAQPDPHTTEALAPTELTKTSVRAA